MNTKNDEFGKTTDGCTECELRNVFSKNCKMNGNVEDCT
jgi:hypothetical protein